MKSFAYQHEVQEKARIAALLEMGYLVVREIGVTWDFPAMARFWLHIAYASCISAVADALGILCPNAYTKPLEAIRQVESKTDLSLEADTVRGLGLDGEIAPAAGALRRIFEAVDRLGTPRWSEQVRQSTRAEYRYYVECSEVEWRIRAAKELASNGDAVSAVYYLRFFAYALACAPMARHFAGLGYDPSYLRPVGAVRPTLDSTCPAIIPELEAILGGSLSMEALLGKIEDLQTFRDTCLALLNRLGFKTDAVKPWAPFEGPTAELATAGEGNIRG